MALTDPFIWYTVLETDNIWAVTLLSYGINVIQRLKLTKTNDTRGIYQHLIWSCDYLLSIQLLRLQSIHFYKRRGDFYRFGVRERPPPPFHPLAHFITSSENYYSHLVLMGWLLLEKLLWNKSLLIRDEGDTLM